MLANPLLAAICLLSAYWAVTVSEYVLLVAVGNRALGLPGVRMATAPLHWRTVPFNPLCNLLFFVPCAALYLSGLSRSASMPHEAMQLAMFWTAGSVVIDLLTWLAPRQRRPGLPVFYARNQPAIALVYLVIFLSPFLARLLMGR